MKVVHLAKERATQELLAISEFRTALPGYVNPEAAASLVLDVRDTSKPAETARAMASLTPELNAKLTELERTAFVSIVGQAIKYLSADEMSVLEKKLDELCMAIPKGKAHAVLPALFRNKEFLNEKYGSFGDAIDAAIKSLASKESFVGKPSPQDVLMQELLPEKFPDGPARKP